MKAHYIIVDEDGDVTFTNDLEVAEEFMDSAVVIDMKRLVHLDSEEPILEATSPTEEEEEEEEEEDGGKEA